MSKKGNVGINNPGKNGRPIKRSAYNSGITAYERTRGRDNPYNRSNMIYSKPPTNNRRILLVIALVLVAIIALTAFACSQGNSNDEQQEQQANEEQQPAEEQASGEQEQGQQQTESTQQASQTSSRISSLSSEGVTVSTTEAGAKSATRTEDNRKATSTSKNNKRPDDKVVYLTFDDGPSTNTHKILDILNQYGVHATWFVIESRGHLDYLSDIWNSGNQIALHSYNHEYDTDYKNDSSYIDGLDKLGAKVEEQIGFSPTLLRFPGGSVNSYNSSVRSAIKSELSQRNWHYFDWNVSSGDASGQNVPAKKIVKNIKKESKGNNSCNVLMHDTEAKGTTVEALPQIIEYYISEGYTFDVLTADSFGYHF